MLRAFGKLTRLIKYISLSLIHIKNNLQGCAMNHIDISPHHSLHVQVIIYTIFASFTAKAGMLDTAESKVKSAL